MFERSIHMYYVISTFPIYGKINTPLYGYIVYYPFISWQGYCHCLAIVLNPVSAIVHTAVWLVFSFLLGIYRGVTFLVHSIAELKRRTVRVCNVRTAMAILSEV